MAFSLAVDTSGKAFDDAGRAELARILRAAADAVEYTRDVEGGCRAADGEAAGMWRLIGILA